MIEYKKPPSFLWHKILIGFGVLILGYLAFLLTQVFVWEMFYLLYIVVGVFCIGYGSVCILTKKTYFSYLHKGIKAMIIILITIGLVAFTYLQVLIISQGMHKEVGNSKYVVVLGALVNGDKISTSLRYRLDAAITMYEEEEDLVFVVSGGQGPEENNSEAYYMKKYMVEQGVPSKQILMEDKSRDTYQNLQYSKEVIEKDAKEDVSSITVVSNAFHTYRAKFLAEKVGFKDVYTYGAKMHLPTIPHYYIRESIGVLKDLITR